MNPRIALIMVLLGAEACAARGNKPVSPTAVAESRDSLARRQLAESPPGRRMVALIDAINAGDSASIIRLGSSHYAQQALAESGGLARLLSRWLEIGETVGRIEVDSVVASSAGTTSVWARGVVSRAWLTFRLVVDSTGDDRIVRVGLGRGIRPLYWAARTTRLSGPDVVREADRYLRALAGADLSSGVVVVAKDGTPLLSRAFGFADRTTRKPMRLDTPFDLASVGKLFTTVAVGRLLQVGRLRLDDTVATYLPELPPQIGRRITIAQLLEHSSGLGELGPALDSAMRNAGSVREMVGRLRDTTLAFIPGSNILYSNRGYILLGAIVERVGGTSYGEMLSREVFQPAGMWRTGLFPLVSPPPDRAHRYTHFATLRSPYAPGDRVEFRPTDDLAPGPHGGAYSTAEDLLRFAHGLTNGVLLDAGTLRALSEPRAGHPWGRGFEAGGEGLSFFFGHAGGTPGMNSVFRVFPRSGYTIIVLSNYDTGANMAGGYLTELLEVASGPR